MSEIFCFRMAGSLTAENHVPEPSRIALLRLVLSEKLAYIEILLPAVPSLLAAPTTLNG
jgi:hypothetical protein